jgi:hypothetical protein
VPLSEHEQRLLEQMERALYEEDPKLASTLRGRSLRTADRRRLLFGVLIVLVGLALLLGGVMTPYWELGVVGFVVMLAGAWYTIRRPSRGTTSARPAGSAGPAKPKRGKQRGSFMQRMEQRWDRRQDEN